MTRLVFLIAISALAVSAIAGSVPEIRTMTHMTAKCPDECSADVVGLVETCALLNGCRLKLCGGDVTATPNLISCSAIEDGTDSNTPVDTTTTTGGSTTMPSTTASTTGQSQWKCSFKVRGIGRPVNGFYSIKCACTPGKTGDASLRYMLSGTDQNCFFECMDKITFGDRCLQRKLKTRTLVGSATGCCTTCGGKKRGNKKCAF